MSKKIRSPADQARANLFYWSKQLRESGRRYPSLESVLDDGGSLAAIFSHMTSDKIAGLSDEDAIRLDEFPVDVFPERWSPTEARNILQVWDEDDIFFSVTPAPPEKPGKPTLPVKVVPELKLTSWWAEWSRRHPDHSEQAALAAAAAEFPGVKVTRRQIRKLRGPQKSGRKSKSAEK